MTLILYGTMSGEKTNLYNPVLALIIVGFILESLSGGVRILLSGADHAYPIVLISANAGNSCYPINIFISCLAHFHEISIYVTYVFIKAFLGILMISSPYEHVKILRV